MHLLGVLVACTVVLLPVFVLIEVCLKECTNIHLRGNVVDGIKRTVEEHCNRLLWDVSGFLPRSGYFWPRWLPGLLLAVGRLAQVGFESDIIRFHSNVELIYALGRLGVLLECGVYTPRGGRG